MNLPKPRLLSAGLLLLWAIRCGAEVRVTIEHQDNAHATPQFKFDKAPPPSSSDAATNATFTALYGDKDGEAGWLDQLHDGKLPAWQDQPPANFCFATGEGGRIQVDLARAINISQVNTYSWHPDTRGPQVYKLYAADGAIQPFNPKPGRGVDPLTCGWKLIATIDTRPAKGDPGGQYAVSISDSDRSLGKYRWLLFDISRTEQADDWGNTFYSEIDVIDKDAPPPVPAAVTIAPPFRIDPPGDPMDWKPPEVAPPLQARYDEATYDRLKKLELAAISLDALRAPDRPVDGVLVQRVDPDSPASALGIKPGDLLMSIDGLPLGWKSGDEELNGARKAMPQQLSIWSPGLGQKTLTIQPGLLGIRIYPGWRAVDAYARSADSDPRWDDDMLTAANSFMTDADLAETALVRATEAGYDGPLLARLRTRIAFGQSRFEDALALGWPARARMADDNVKLLNDAALASFKLEQSLDLAARYPEVLGNEDDIRAVVNAYRALPREARRNPLAELPDLHTTRITQFDAFVPQQNPESADASKWAVPLLNSRHGLPFNVESGHYFSCSLTPGFANVALAVHFNVHDTDKNATDFARCISIGLFDLSKSREQGPRPQDAIKVSLMTDGGAIVAPFGRPGLRLVPAKRRSAGAELEETIRLIILHDRCEVTLDDGRRLYYGPLLADEATRRYAFFIQGVGISGNVLSPIWQEIDDPKPAPAIKR